MEASSGCRVGSREGGEVMREAKPRSRRLLRAPRGPHRWLIVACQSSRPEWDRALGGWEEIESEPLQGELFSLIQQLRLFPSTLIFFFFLLLCTKKSPPDSIMSPRLLSLHSDGRFPQCLQRRERILIQEAEWCTELHLLHTLGNCAAWGKLPKAPSLDFLLGKIGIMIYCREA